jgi:hypothetical protein
LRSGSQITRLPYRRSWDSAFLKARAPPWWASLFAALRKSTVRLSPSAFDPSARSPTLVFEQTLLHQNRDHPVPIHLEIDSEFFDRLTMVCKEIAKRH